jgi:hypothetical protein
MPTFESSTENAKVALRLRKQLVGFLRYSISTFVNVTTCPHYNNNMIIKIKQHIFIFNKRKQS